MKKSRFITPEIEQEIIHMIEVTVARAGDVTWSIIAGNTGFTRAALSRNENIKAAYDSAKNKTKQVITDAEKIELLTIENEKLTKNLAKAKALIKEYDSKYIAWIYNAQSAGITPEKLNQPMPEGFKTTIRKKGK